MGKSKKYAFWAIVDEHGDIVSVNHKSFGELKAVFNEKSAAEKALSVSIRGIPEHVKWRVVAAEICKPGGRDEHFY